MNISRVAYNKKYGHTMSCNNKQSHLKAQKINKNKNKGRLELYPWKYRKLAREALSPVTLLRSPAIYTYATTAKQF